MRRLNCVNHRLWQVIRVDSQAGCWFILAGLSMFLQGGARYDRVECHTSRWSSELAAAAKLTTPHLDSVRSTSLLLLSRSTIVRARVVAHGMLRHLDRRYIHSQRRHAFHRDTGLRMRSSPTKSPFLHDL